MPWCKSAHLVYNLVYCRFIIYSICGNPVVTAPEFSWRWEIAGRCRFSLSVSVSVWTRSATFDADSKNNRATHFSRLLSRSQDHECTGCNTKVPCQMLCIGKTTCVQRVQHEPPVCHEYSFALDWLWTQPISVLSTCKQIYVYVHTQWLYKVHASKIMCTYYYDYYLLYNYVYLLLWLLFAECATGSRHGDDSPFLAPTTTESMLHAMSVQLSLASLVLLDLCCVIFACCSMLASPADRSHAWQPHAPLVFEPAGSKVATASSQCSLG